MHTKTIMCLAVMPLLGGCSIFDIGRDSFAADTKLGTTDGDDTSPDETDTTTMGEEPDVPTPTTSTTGSAPESGDETETGTGSDTEAVADPVEIVEFSTSFHSMDRAGSLVFEAEVDGPVSFMELRVHLPGEAEPRHELWEVGEPTLEYIVDSDAFNGETTFELYASSEDGADDSATQEVLINLPPPGTLDGRWTLDGNEWTVGTAIAIRPGSGLEPDMIVAVGTKNDVPILVTLNGGQLKTKPLGGQMDFVVPHAIALDGDTMFLAGELLGGGAMILRRYDLKTGAQIWDRSYDDARAFDVGVGPDGMVYAVGEVDVDGLNPHTRAAVWMVSESGGGDWEPATLVRFDQLNNSIGSSLRGVTFVDNRVVIAGSVELELPSYPSRASLFELANDKIEILDVISGPFEEEVSGWNSIWLADADLHLVGWHKATTVDPPSAAAGRFGLDLEREEFSLSWPGLGKAIAVRSYSIAVGSRSIDAKPRFYAEASTWAEPYTESAGDASVANAVAVSRHGETYIIGAYTEGGIQRLVLTRHAP